MSSGIAEFLGKTKKTDVTDEDVIRLHDLFMREYGWIPLKEFMELPIPCVTKLLDRIKEYHENEKKQMSKARRH